MSGAEQGVAVFEETGGGPSEARVRPSPAMAAMAARGLDRLPQWQRVVIGLGLAWVLLRVADLAVGPGTDLLPMPVVLLFGGLAWLAALAGLVLIAGQTVWAARTSPGAAPFWLGASAILAVVAWTFTGYRIATIGLIAGFSGMDNTAAHAFLSAFKYEPATPILPLSLLGAWLAGHVPALAASLSLQTVETLTIGAVVVSLVVLVFVRGTGILAPLLAAALAALGASIVYGEQASGERAMLFQALLPAIAVLLAISLLESLRRKALKTPSASSSARRGSGLFLVFLVFLAAPVLADIHNNFSRDVAALRISWSQPPRPAQARATPVAAQTATPAAARTAAQATAQKAPVRRKGGRVVATQLNIRSGPDSSHDAVAKLMLGDRVDILEVRDGWARIGHDQWVSLRYLEVDP